MTSRAAASWPAVTVGLLAVLYVLWTRGEWGGPFATLAFSDIIIGLAAGAAGVACVAGSRRQTGWAGRGWLLIGVGMLFWALGEAVWSFYEVVLSVEVPFPSLADAAFLLMVPLTLVGMAAMLEFRQVAVRTFFDGFMVAASLLIVSWPTVLEHIYSDADQGVFARSIALAYPIGDIVVASAAFVLLSQTARHTRGTLALAGTGILAIAVADFGFAYMTAHDEYSSASVIDPGWFVGFLIIALAGLKVYRSPAPSQAPHQTRLLVLLPYVPLGAAIVTATVLQTTKGTMGTVPYVTLVFLVVCVVLRQLVTLRENLTLTRRLNSTVDDLRATEAELRRLAYHDPLTGLANRAMLQECTEQAAQRQRKDQSSLGVLYVDLDNFKPVNDSFGHAAGDALLVMVADRLRACTRPTDVVARLGGDEFVVLLVGLDNERDAEKLGRRIVAELGRPFTVEGHDVSIGASIGVAVQHFGDRDGDLLRDADMAMYTAKLGGKNTLVCFDAVLRDRMVTAA